MTTERLSYPVCENSEKLKTEKRSFLETEEQLDNLGFVTDFELVQAAAKGVVLAFEEIYNRHHRRVYSVCMRMLRNSAEAEDLTQDVFLQLYRKIGSFRGDSAFTTWLHRLTVNQVLMHFRKRNVKFEKTTEEGKIPVQIVSGTENPKKLQIIDQIALGKAMAQLSTGYRNVFVLHDIEGYEHEEVAKILGCAVGTSKSQLHKARLKLQKLLLGKKGVFDQWYIHDRAISLNDTKGIELLSDRRHNREQKLSENDFGDQLRSAQREFNPIEVRRGAGATKPHHRMI